MLLVRELMYCKPGKVRPLVEKFGDMMEGKGLTEDDAKEFDKIMKGYHDLVEYGRREIYKIEG
jgi:hypothetical protein